MYEYNDTDLGRIFIKPNQRAKRVIARKKADHILLTVPFFYGKKDILKALEKLKPQLLAIETKPSEVIDEDFAFSALTFNVKIRRFSIQDTVRMMLKNGELSIFVPQQADISDDKIQQIIKSSIRQALRFEAKRILSQKTAVYAKKHNLQFSSVKINKSQTRWGSCSRLKSINFSYYLLLLPEKLIDYVVLHELAHTVEMNHSAKFWNLLDTLCGEDSKALSAQTRKFSSREYDLVKE